MSGTAWNLIASLFNQGSVFFINILVARFLGKNDFGKYAIVQSTILSIAMLVQLSIGYTVTKYVAEFRSTNREKTERILALCSIISTVMAFLGFFCLIISAQLISANVLKSTHLTAPIRFGAAYVLFTAINGYQMGALSGLESYRALAISGILSGLSAIACLILGVWILGLNGALLGLSASAFLRYIFHKWSLQAEFKKNGFILRFDGIGEEKNIFLNFAIPAILSSYIYLPIAWLANAMLVRQSDGFSQMALYSACTNIRLLVLFLPLIIHNVGLVLLNNIKGQGDLHRYNKLSKANLFFILGAALFVALILALLRNYILKYYGNGFTDGANVLLVLLVSTIPESLYLAFYQQINAHGRMWLSLFGVVIPWQTAFAIFFIILVPKYGALGLAFAYLIASIVQFMMTSYFALRLRKIYL